jgi:hypothetical protein
LEFLTIFQLLFFFVNLIHVFSRNPYRYSMGLALRSTPHDGAYHTLYNVERYEINKHFEVEENRHDLAVTCMKVL